MKPYFDQDGITIYHGDCREVLPNITADVLITDPPYGTGYYASDRDVLSGSLFTGWATTYKTLAVFGWPERLVALCMASGIQPSEWVTWWPTNGALRGLNFQGLRRESEHVAIFGPHHLQTLRQPRGKSSRRMVELDYRQVDGSVGRGLDTHGELETRGCGDVWTDSAPGLLCHHKKRQHPNEKSLAVCSRLVDGLTVDGDVVLDPFAGSGTTLVAARQLGRRAIGIEIEERYCEIAAKRLCQESLEDAA